VVPDQRDPVELTVEIGLEDVGRRQVRGRAVVPECNAVISPLWAVFIEVENSPVLREFRERLRDIAGAPPLIPPHISLLYTLDRVSQAHRPDLNAEVLAAIAARCAEVIEDTEFILSRLVVNSTGAAETDVRNWTFERDIGEEQ